MRKSKWLPALVLGLCFAGQAPAQTLNLFNFGTTQPIQNVPIDTSTANIPIAQPQTLPNAVGHKLASFIPGFTSFSNQRVTGVSQFPTPSQMPGLDYLKAFKYGRGVPIVP